MTEKVYKVYKMKYGLDKYKVVPCDAIFDSIMCRNELKLALVEAQMRGKGYYKLGDTLEQFPTFVEIDLDDDSYDKEDCELDEEENRKDFRMNR